MTDLWAESGQSIILLPSGKQGEDLFEVAKLWTELRLIGPAVWVRPEMLADNQTRPPLQSGIVLGIGKSGSAQQVEIDLFEQLARQELKTVRLLVVRTAVADSEFDRKQNDLVSLLVEYLRYSMPGGGQGSNRSEERNKLVLLNLVTGPTEFEPDYGRQLGGLEFNANFVAASEDRATPHSGDAFVRFDPATKKFAGHTLMHVASIAALWNGIPQGTYELLKAGVANFGEQAFVSRVFLSAILTDGLARRAATRVLNRAADAQSGVIDLSMTIPIAGTYPIPDDKADDFINELVSKTFEFDGGVLAYKRPISEADQGARAWAHWWQQFGHFFAFAGDKLARVPYFAGIWLWRKFVRLLNNIFQAGNKGAEFIREPEERLDRMDLTVSQEYKAVTTTKEQADNALHSPVTPSLVRTTPDLWSKIRTMLFGILDGSNLEQFGFQKEENKLPIFYRVSSLFNDPSAALEIVDPKDDKAKLSLDWAAAGRADELVAEFETKATRVSQQLEKLEANAQPLKTNVAAIEKKIALLEEHLETLVTEQAEAAAEKVVKPEPEVAVPASEEVASNE